MGREITIAAEDQEVIEAYLRIGDTKMTADQLSISPYEVTAVLSKKPVKDYLTTLYTESGFRNRNEIAQTLDNIIRNKLEEMEEAEATSNKDIVDILYTMHKIKMEELQFLERMEKNNPSVQNNKQNNIYLGGDGAENYRNLMKEIVSDVGNK